MIVSQTKIFNVFPSAIQLGNRLNILTNNCDKEAISYIPSRDLWINISNFSISNEQKNCCLTIDCRNSGSAKYRTNAENEIEQFCYFAQKKKDRLYNTFLAKRINKDDKNITFEIDSVINTSKNGDIKLYKAVEELKSLIKNDGRNNVREQYTKQAEHFDNQNGRGRQKNGRRPRFLL